MKKLTFQLAGHFTLIAVKPDGTERILADFDNLILDQGLNRMGSGGILQYCQVGSGSTAPITSNTALQAKIAHTNTYQSNTSFAQVAAPYFGTMSMRYRFAAGVATGNISEVGVGWAATGSLFSRALVLDGVGSPTTITILSDETLDVIYELRIYPPASAGDTTGTVTLDGVSYDYIIRPAYITNNSYWVPSDIYYAGASTPGFGTFAFTGDIGPLAGTPSGTSTTGSVTTQPYGNNNLYNDYRVNFTLTQGNLSGGIRSVVFATNIGAYQCQFNPKIPKDSTKTLYIDFRIAWARKSI